MHAHYTLTTLLLRTHVKKHSQFGSTTYYVFHGLLIHTHSFSVLFTMATMDPSTHRSNGEDTAGTAQRSRNPISNPRGTKFRFLYRRYPRLFRFFFSFFSLVASCCPSFDLFLPFLLGYPWREIIIH